MAINPALPIRPLALRSADAGNALAGGSDQGLFVPDVRPAMSSPVQMKPGIGVYVGNVPATATTTQASATNRMDISPFVSPYDIGVNQVMVSVTTGVASGQVRAVLFGSDANGRPTTYLAQSDAGDASTAGAKFLALPVTLFRGVLYWLGTWTTQAPTLRVWDVPGTIPLSWSAVAAPVSTSVLTRNTTWGTTPGNWSYATGQHTARLAPMILLRVNS